MKDITNQIHQGYLLAAYTATYRICEDTPITTAYFVFESCVRLIYELSFPLSVQIPNSNFFPIIPFIVARNLWTFNSQYLVQQITAYVVSFFCLANLAFFLYLVYFYSYNRSSRTLDSWFAKVMKYHLQWSSGPLFVPYVSMLLNYMTTNSLNASTIFKASLGEVIYFFIVIALHTLMTLFYVVTVYEWAPLNNKLNSKAHSRVCIVGVLCKALATIAAGFIFQSANTTQSFGLIVFFLIYECFIAFAFWYELPYYVNSSNQAYISIYAVSAMASLSLLLRLATQDSGDSICIVMFFLGSTLLLPTVNVVTKSRITLINSKPIASLKSSTEIDIRVRQCLLKATAKNRDNNSEVAEKSTSFQLSEIANIFRKHGKAFRGYFKVNIIWATFSYFHKGNRFLAMQKLQEVLQMSPLIFDVLDVEARLRFISSHISPDEVEPCLLTYEEQQRLERYAISCISKCLVYHIRFWGTIISDDYALENLEVIASSITKNTDEARLSLQRLIYLNPKNATFRRLYSQFLSSIMNDEAGAKRQLMRAVELENEEEESSLLTDSSNCVIILSCEKDTFSQIVQANNKTCELLGVSSEDIVGKKITSYMAKPYAICHQQRLNLYIEERIGDFSRTARNCILVKNTNGFIFEGDIQVREYSDFTLVPTISFFGSIRPHKVQNICVVKQSDMHVTDVSVPFFNLFNPDLQRLKNNDYLITEAIPSFSLELNNMSSVLQQGHGYTFSFSHDKDDQKTTLAVTISNLRYLESEYYYVLIQGEQISEEGNDAWKNEKMTPGKGNDSSNSGKRRSSINNEVKAVHLHSNDQESSSSDSNEHEVSQDNDNDDDDEEEDKLHKSEVLSSVSSSKSGNLLRTGLIRTGSKLDRKIRYLFIWILLLIFIICGLGICVQVISSILTINRYTATLQVLVTPVRSGIYTASYSALMYSHLFQGSLFTDPVDIQREDERIRRDLLSAKNKLDSLKEILFTDAQTLTQEELNFINGVKITVLNEDGQATSVLLIEVVQLYVNAITIVLSKNYTQLSIDDRSLSFIQTNANNTVPDVWAQICEKILQVQSQNTQLVKSTELVIDIVAISLTGVVVFLVFIPLLYLLLKERISIYWLFERVEPGNLRTIYSQSIGKLTDFEGGDSTVNNVDLQDMMEVIATKRIKSDDPTKRNSRLQLKLSTVIFSRDFLLLFFILLLAVGYFLGYYFWWSNLENTQFEGIDDRVYLSKVRGFYTREISYHLFNWNNTSKISNINLTEVENLEDLLFATDHALYFSDPSLGVISDIRVYNGGGDILEGDICQQFVSNDINTYNITPCETYDNGILGQGGHAAFTYALSLSKGLRKTISEGNTTAIIERLLEFKDLVDNWMPYVSLLFDNWISNVFLNGFTSAQNVRIIGTILFILFCIIVVLIIYYPMIKNMNKTLQKTRQLLTMIPPEVVESSKALKEQLRKIAIKMVQEN